jgi:RND superfamily putative drug exporter
VQQNEQTSFLPAGAESTTVVNELDRFAQGDVAIAVVVYRREGGLTAADRSATRADRRSLQTDRPPATGTIPQDDTAAIISAPILVDQSQPGADQTLVDAVSEIRDRVSDVPGGLQVAVTGGAGFSADAIEVFGNIDQRLLLFTAGLVFVLLVLVYRSPIFWALPLLAAGFAEITVRGIG